MGTKQVRSNMADILKDLEQKAKGVPVAIDDAYREIIKVAAEDTLQRYTPENWASTGRGFLRYLTPPNADLFKTVTSRRAGRDIVYNIPMYYSKKVASRSGQTRDSLEQIARIQFGSTEEIDIKKDSGKIKVAFTPKVKALEMGSYNKKTGARRRKRPYLWEAITAYQKALKWLSKKLDKVLAV